MVSLCVNLTQNLSPILLLFNCLRKVGFLFYIPFALFISFFFSCLHYYSPYHSRLCVKLNYYKIFIYYFLLINYRIIHTFILLLFILKNFPFLFFHINRSRFRLIYVFCTTFTRGTRRRRRRISVLKTLKTTMEKVSLYDPERDIVVDIYLSSEDILRAQRGK